MKLIRKVPIVQRRPDDQKGLDDLADSGVLQCQQDPGFPEQLFT